MPLREELDFLESYLGIERARFDGRLDYEIAVPDELLEARVPNLILQPLVENALRHGLEERPEGGNVRVSTRLATDDSVVIEVEDDGVGIPDAIRPKVFDPFFTTRLGRGGSGLGLHIAHNLTTGLLGGTLELAPADPTRAGSRFVLRLPRVAPGNA